MKLYTFEYTGTHPILMHNPAGMKGSGAGKLDTKRIPSPEDEALAGRYVTEDGKYLRFPLQAFKSSLVGGGVGRRIGKRSATSVLKATVFPAEAWVTLLDAKTKKPIKADEYTIDTRRAVVQGNGVLRSRPLVMPWCCLAPFEVDDIIDNPELLIQIGELAGRMVGIGDFRPERGGPFGRYKVKLAS
jgi:hypothetical protein